MSETQPFAIDGDVTNEEFKARAAGAVQWSPLGLFMLWFEGVWLGQEWAAAMFPHVAMPALIAWVFVNKRDIVATLLAATLAMRDGFLAYFEHRHALLNGEPNAPA